jgi:transposase
MDMSQRIWRRSSLAFRVKVVGEIELGVFDSVSAAGRPYGISGADTIWGWIRKLGKNHLLAKEVRVETLNERDELAKLRQQVKRLEQALGQTQAENLLNQSYLQLACERLGEEVEAFRKKCVGGQSTSPVKRS